MQYAEAQCYGRIAANALRRLGDVVAGRRRSSPLDPVVLEALRWVLQRLESAPPRPLFGDKNTASVLLYTDAASEGEHHSCGAVILDVHTGTREYFSLDIAPALISEWRTGGLEQVITHAEVYPVYLARVCWQRLIIGRRILCFVDNNAATFSLIRGFMDSATGDWLVRAVMHQEFLQGAWTWYARVPSASNPSDEVSRRDLTWVRRHNYQEAHVVQPISFRQGEAVYAEAG